MLSAQSHLGKKLPRSFGFQWPVILFQELRSNERKNIMGKIFRAVLAREFTLVLRLAFAKLSKMLKGINKLTIFL